MKFQPARPYAFVVGPYGVFFRPRSRKCVRPALQYGTFINSFAKKRLAGPHESFDNRRYIRKLRNYKGWTYLSQTLTQFTNKKTDFSPGVRFSKHPKTFRVRKRFLKFNLFQFAEKFFTLKPVQSFSSTQDFFFCLAFKKTKTEFLLVNRLHINSFSDPKVFGSFEKRTPDQTKQITSSL